MTLPVSPTLTNQSQATPLGTLPLKRTVEDLLKCGVLVLDKPCGPTSHEAAAFARKIVGIDKAGHTGTLDANVSGVLVVLLGEACKLSHYFADTTKAYECIMRLNAPVAKKEVEQALENFKGRIYQKPPLESAVAKRLRVREVYALNVLEVQGKLVLFHVNCEAGTYIRNICRDAGEILGVGGQMAQLRRTKALQFYEKDAHTLQQISDYTWLYKQGKPEKLHNALIPIENAGLNFKKATVTDEAAKKMINGAPAQAQEVIECDETLTTGELAGVFTQTGQLFAVAQVLEHPKSAPAAKIALKTVRVLNVL